MSANINKTNNKFTQPCSIIHPKANSPRSSRTYFKYDSIEESSQSSSLNSQSYHHFSHFLNGFVLLYNL